MKKTAIVARVAMRIFLPEETVNMVTTALIAELAAALARDERVAIRGLGRFKNARQRRQVPCELTRAVGVRTYPSFRASDTFKAQVAKERSTRKRERNALYK